MRKSGARLRMKNNGVQIKRLARLSGKSAVLVGVLSGTGEHPKGEHGQTVAEIAFWNEFGTTRTPPRPFLTRTMEEHQYYAREFKKLLAAHLRGDVSPQMALSQLGLIASVDVKATITAIQDPPNAPATQRAKANKSHVQDDLVNNPLIDSGTLRASINYEVIP